VRATTPLALLFSDGIVEEYGGSRSSANRRTAPPKRKPATKAPSAPAAPSSPSNAPAYQPAPRQIAQSKPASEVPIALEGPSAALAERLREWRSAEAKRLGVPAFVVLHDRTLNALANRRPRNPGELLGIEGMGPSKVGRFGAAILELCQRN
jgi:ATP-dependent DNA helicase RecQ